MLRVQILLGRAFDLFGGQVEASRLLADAARVFRAMVRGRAVVRHTCCASDAPLICPLLRARCARLTNLAVVLLLFLLLGHVR